MLQTYTHEIGDLRDQLQTMRQDGVYLPSSQYERMVNTLKERAEKVTELEAVLSAKDQEISSIQECFDKQEQQLVHPSWVTTHKTQEEKKGELSKTQENLDETTGKLKDTEELLSTAEAALEEHQVVLKEHEDTEATFHGQADNMLATLSGTISDVDGLHAKIGIHFFASAFYPCL